MGLEFGLRVSAGSGTMNLNPLSALGGKAPRGPKCVPGTSGQVGSGVV